MSTERFIKSLKSVIKSWHARADVGDPNDPFDWDEETLKINSPWHDMYKAEKCECGASHTSAPNLHLYWCPLYKNPMGGNF